MSDLDAIMLSLCSLLRESRVGCARGGVAKFQVVVLECVHDNYEPFPSEHFETMERRPNEQNVYGR